MHITLLLSLKGSDILRFLHSGVLTLRDSYVQSLYAFPGVLTSRCSLVQRLLHPRVLTPWSSCVRTLLHPGVLTFRGSYIVAW